MINLYIHFLILKLKNFLLFKNNIIIIKMTSKLNKRIQTSHLLCLTNYKNLNIMELRGSDCFSKCFLCNNNTLTTFINCSEASLPGQTLIIGDSKITIPKYIKDNNNTKFDVIFIDSTENFEIVKEYLNIFFYLAHKDTLIILNNTIFTTEFETDDTIGSTKAWVEYTNSNKILAINHKDYIKGKGMSWGKFNM